MAVESPAKRAKKDVDYFMNVNNAVDKAWEDKSLTDIAQAPISALQGLADWTDEEFAKLGLSSINELGTWKFFLLARAMCKLAETEITDKRDGTSRLNVNNALDKAHETKHLRDVLKLPPSALQGLAPWVDEVLAKLHVKTIAQLGNWKYAEWANSIATLTPKEVELPPVIVPKKPPTAAKAEPAPTATAAPPIPPRAGTAPDAEAVSFAATHDGGDLAVNEHIKLAHVDIEKNLDKYFTMQTLKFGTQFLFVSRWGRTGSRGQAKLEGPYETFEEAHSHLEAKFKEKTGNDVESVAAGTFKHIVGKYDLVHGDTGATRDISGAGGGCLWQYYVDDGVDGKRTGWHDYTSEAAEIVEGAFAEWQNNPDQGMSVRSVQSGNFCYHINFDVMKQTNVTHPNRTQRQIQRNAA